MKNVSTTGIILRQKNIFEQDKLLTFFSKEYGKITVHAKGTRKITSRRAQHLELFNICLLHIYETSSGKKILTHCERKQDFPNIKNDLKRLTAASYIAEIMDKLLFENQPSLKKIKLLYETLVLLEKNTDIYLVGAAFTIKLLTFLGHLPDLPDKYLKKIQKSPLNTVKTLKIASETSKKLFIQSQKLLKNHLPMEKINSARFLANF